MIITKRGVIPEKVDRAIKGFCASCTSEAEAKLSELEETARTSTLGYRVLCPICKQDEMLFMMLGQ